MNDRNGFTMVCFCYLSVCFVDFGALCDVFGAKNEACSPRISVQLLKGKAGN